MRGMLAGSTVGRFAMAQRWAAAWHGVAVREEGGRAQPA
jgi:hypothetical protein